MCLLMVPPLWCLSGRGCYVCMWGITESKKRRIHKIEEEQEEIPQEEASARLRSQEAHQGAD